MEKSLMEYISGRKNVCGNIILSREKIHEKEFVHVIHPDLQEPLYEFWAGTKKTRKTGEDRRAGQKSTEHHQGEMTAQPKHTGGKKPYVMLMTEALAKMAEDGVPPPLVGYMIYLSPYIEWETGRLVCGRKKKRMKIPDIEKAWGISRRATIYTLAELRKYGLLTYAREGYFISRDILRRGRGSENADQIREGNDAGGDHDGVSPVHQRK